MQGRVFPYPLDGPFPVLPTGAPGQSPGVRDLLIVAPFSNHLIQSLEGLGWDTEWLRVSLRSPVSGPLDRVMVSFPLASFPQGSNWSPGSDVAAFREWYHLSTRRLGWCHSMAWLDRATGPDGVTVVFGHCLMSIGVLALNVSFPFTSSDHLFCQSFHSGVLSSRPLSDPASPVTDFCVSTWGKVAVSAVRALGVVVNPEGQSFGDRSTEMAREITFPARRRRGDEDIRLLSSSDRMVVRCVSEEVLSPGVDFQRATPFVFRLPVILASELVSPFELVRCLGVLCEFCGPLVGFLCWSHFLFLQVVICRTRSAASA